MSKTSACLSRTKSSFCKVKVLDFSFAQLKSLSVSGPENKRFKVSEPRPSTSTEYPDPLPMEARQSSPEIKKWTLPPLRPPLLSNSSCISSVMSPLGSCHVPLQPNPPVRLASENDGGCAARGFATNTLAATTINHSFRRPIG